jgi:hypothetical protein
LEPPNPKNLLLKIKLPKKKKQPKKNQPKKKLKKKLKKRKKLILLPNSLPLLSDYTTSKLSSLTKKIKKKELQNSGNNMTLKDTQSGTSNMINTKEKELNYS